MNIFLKTERTNIGVGGHTKERIGVWLAAGNEVGIQFAAKKADSIEPVVLLGA